MLRLIGVSLLYILLCNPPILFFLNRMCKKRFRFGWVSLFSFLLGWFLCFPVGFIITTDLVQEYGEGVWFLVILFGVTTGWLVSGVILLFWASIITIFLAKSIKIKVLMVSLVLACILSVGAICIHHRNFWRVPGNRLIHEEYDRAFLDGHFLRVFETENDLLKKKLIREWELKAYTLGANPKSFAPVSPDTPEWWPSEDLLNDLERYGWVDKSKRLYCSLWYDPNTHRMYVENGDW